MIDTSELKARVSLIDLLTADGIQPLRSGVNHKASCPFHDERTPSFTIYPDGHYKCFGCGESGDVISYAMKSRGVDFTEAARMLTDRAGIVAELPRPARPAMEAKRETHEAPTQAAYRRVLGMAEALAGNPRRCERIAQARSWKPQTVRQLALDGFLGWYEGKTALAFLYEYKAKLRWKERGERQIIWDGKGPITLWRSFLLTRPGVRRVLVTEGETDAITLIDAGAEDGRTVVVALPSANNFKEEWARDFAGKEAVLMLDNDTAGEGATEKVLAALKQHARGLAVLDWKAVAP